MHDRDKFRSELGLHITGDMFDCGGDGVLSCEQRVHDDAKAFHLEVGLVKGLEGTAIIEVVIERDSEVGVSDGGDERSVFGRGRE